MAFAVGAFLGPSVALSVVAVGLLGVTRLSPLGAAASCSTHGWRALVVGRPGGGRPPRRDSPAPRQAQLDALGLALWTKVHPLLILIGGTALGWVVGALTGPALP